MLRRSLCATVLKRCASARVAAAAASPMVGAASLGLLAGGPHPQPLRFDFGATPQMHFAVRHCASSSTPPGSGNGASSAPSSLPQQQPHAAESKTATSRSPPDAEDVGRKAHAGGGALVNDMKACATWWDTYVFGHDKDGVDNKSDPAAKTVKFSFSGSITELCTSLEVTDPAARAQLETDVYSALLLHAREKLNELIAARKALATALNNSPQDVDEKMKKIIKMIGDGLACSEYKDTRVFPNIFPGLSLLKENKAVVAALHDENSALNKLLGALTATPPLDCVSGLLLELRADFDKRPVAGADAGGAAPPAAARSASSATAASTAAGAEATNDDMPRERSGTREFGKDRIRREICFADGAWAKFEGRYVDPPLLVSRLMQDGTYQPTSITVPAANRFLVFAGESGSGKTISALQYAVSRWDKSLNGKRAGIYMLARNVFGAPGSLHRASAETDDAFKERRNNFVVENVVGKVLSTLGSKLYLPSTKIKHAVTWCCTECGGAEPAGKVPALFSTSAESSCITVVIDEIGVHAQELRGLISVAEKLCDALAKVLNVGRVRIVAVGTGADGATVAMGSSPKKYYVVQCGDQRDCWKVFEKLLRANFDLSESWNLRLTDAVQRVLENSRVAALFAREVDKIYAAVYADFLEKGAGAGTDRRIVDSDAVRTLAMQALPVALERFRRLNGLGHLKSPGTAMLHALVYADSGAISTIPSEKWQDADRLLTDDKQSVVAIAQDEWNRCGAKWGLLTDRATRTDTEDPCITARKSFTDVFKAVSPVLDAKDATDDEGKYVNLPTSEQPDEASGEGSASNRISTNNSTELRNSSSDDGHSRFRMSPAMRAAALFEISDRLQHDARIFGAAAGPALEHDVFDCLVLRAVAPPLDARFCDFSHVTLLRHIMSGLGNDPAKGTNLRRTYVIRNCHFRIERASSVDKTLATAEEKQKAVDTKQEIDDLASVRCMNRESFSVTAPDQSSGITVRDALGIEKAAIVVLNGPEAEYADVAVLAPNKLVLVQCRCHRPETEKVGEGDARAAFVKMGWPVGGKEKHMVVTKALIDLCRVGGTGSAGDFTVELVYVFSGSNMAKKNPEGRHHVTHGPFPFRSTAQRKAWQKQPGASADDESSSARHDGILYRRWIIHSGTDGKASREQYLAVRAEHLAATAMAAGDPATNAEFKDLRDALFECSVDLHALFPLIGSTQQDHKRKQTFASTIVAGEPTVQ
jgi:hypothetical protein